MDRIIRCDSKVASYQKSEEIYDAECAQKKCPTPKEERTTKYRFAVYENILSGQYGLHIPSYEWADLPAKYKQDISASSPLWIDERLISGKPFFAVGLSPIGFGIVNPTHTRESFEGRFSKELIIDIRNSARKYDSQVRVRAKRLIHKIVQRRVNREKLLETLDPYDFEEVVAELLNDNGFDVFLTPRTNDGGKDVIAAYSTDTGTNLMMVECKRRKTEKTLGPPEVRALMGVFGMEKRKGKGYDCAMLITTAKKIGPSALEFEDVFSELSIKNYSDLMSWVETYGKIKEELWVPEQFDDLFADDAI
jgi:hypothetical protein